MALLTGTTLIFVGLLPIGITIGSLLMLLKNINPTPNPYGQTEPMNIGVTVASLAGMLFGIVLLVIMIGAFA